MKKRIVITAFSIALIAMFVTTYVSYYLTPETKNGSDVPFFPLLPPPASATDYGNPLDTSTIGLMAYVYNPSGWTLANTVPAFLNYTDHGSYYDGYIRVYENCTGNLYADTDKYLDMGIRVASSGWVTVWMDRSNESKAFIPYWGRTCPVAGWWASPPAGAVGTGAPVANATLPMRGIEQIYYRAGVSFVGYNSISLYDYQYPTANKLLIFGKAQTRGGTYDGITYTYTMTFPSVTNNAIIATYTSIGISGAQGAYHGESSWSVNGVHIFGYHGYCTTTWTTISNYTLYLDMANQFQLYQIVPDNYLQVSTYADIATIVWLS